MASIWRKIYAKMYSFFSSKSYGELKDPETYNKLKNFASKISSLYQSENIDLTKLSSKLYEFVGYVLMELHPPEAHIGIAGTLFWRAYQIQVTLGKEWEKNKPGDEGKISAIGAYCCFRFLKFSPKHNSRWNQELCDMIRINEKLKNTARTEVARKIFKEMSSVNPQYEEESFNKYFNDIGNKYGCEFSDLGVDEIKKEVVSLLDYRKNK